MASCFLYRRREFITLLGGAAAWPLAARAQQQDRPQQVAILFGGFSESDPEPRARIKAFKQQLQELGGRTAATSGCKRAWGAVGRIKCALTRRNVWACCLLCSRPTADLPWPPCCGTRAPYRLFSQASSTRLAVASFQASPIQEVMPPASLVLIRP